MEIYGLLMSGFFFCQIWHIPVTWIFGLVSGAVMPSIWLAFGITHGINIVGVACTYKLSKQYLGNYIQTSEKFKPHIEAIDKKV